ncbi:SMI1/KNR4 family protein [Streptomyces sp. NPDC127049]|uniref:SMI1/KNR4 family protein n=1 Tax=Streptomyces sp. NPDC127049 TaxID=3347118 RepID=UPI00366422DA
MNAIDELVRLCPPPSVPPPAVDWARAERALGVPLPADYKRLVETYGQGVFTETVWLLAPGAAEADLDLVAQTAERDEILESLWDIGEERPEELGEPGARVVPWAYEEGSGAFLYWLARPDRHPDTWPVLYNEGRGPLWERHGPGCAAFLLGVLTGTAKTSYFGYLYEVLKPAEHRFEPAAEAFGG